ncbi:low molecular weight protein-tyrosine-phosphatase [Variovorax sp.]|jgi:protein-tyrosine phosphatase|uniref:low molecular weight protein-tyrosine-phosphatase n=1 Tax=Variovorax sp. TaxID=1871043 RepID=UPI000C419AA9|nr:low molecular weight protein-tyrosine-phosphatase [Variovorax sp.]MBS82230.1 protein tyrosine phosphatase [Variovorax sp.]
MKSVLTVCIGNICRSPMAEGLLTAKLPNIHISSAGTGALVGRPADTQAQKLMLQHGIDISRHVARQVNKLICSQADLILVMDVEQRRYLEATYPMVRGKVFRIAEAAKTDVPDPYREGEDAFRYAFDLIEMGARTWIDRILKITEREQQIT